MRWEPWVPRLVEAAMARAEVAARGRPEWAQGMVLGLGKGQEKAQGLSEVRGPVPAQGLGLATGQAPSSLAHPSSG